jgi:hypothetical protein
MAFKRAFKRPLGLVAPDHPDKSELKVFQRAAIARSAVSELSANLGGRL